jgi:hypothetical protein
MKKCPFCGTINDQWALTCRQCGNLCSAKVGIYAGERLPMSLQFDPASIALQNQRNYQSLQMQYLNAVFGGNPFRFFGKL